MSGTVRLYPRRVGAGLLGVPVGGAPFVAANDGWHGGWREIARVDLATTPVGTIQLQYPSWSTRIRARLTRVALSAVASIRIGPISAGNQGRPLGANVFQRLEMVSDAPSTVFPTFGSLLSTEVAFLFAGPVVAADPCIDLTFEAGGWGTVRPGFWYETRFVESVSPARWKWSKGTTTFGAPPADHTGFQIGTFAAPTMNAGVAVVEAAA